MNIHELIREVERDLVGRDPEKEPARQVLDRIQYRVTVSLTDLRRIFQWDNAAKMLKDLQSVERRKTGRSGHETQEGEARPKDGGTVEE